MSFIFFILLVFLCIVLLGVSIVLSLLGQGLRGILSIFGIGKGKEQIGQERPSWKEESKETTDENKLDIRTEDGVRRIRKMKDSAETIDFEEVKTNNEQ